MPSVSYRIERAIEQVQKTDSVVLSVNSKKKSLIKFGRNDDLSTTKETVWQVGGMEAYPVSTNTINTLVSTSESDTGDVVIEGHTITDGVVTFVTQTLTLNGTTDVPLTTPLWRANRLYNDGATDFVGNVTVRIDGGTTHLSAIVGSNQSLKAATSISSNDYWFVTGLSFGVNRQQTRNVDFEFQVREYGKVFRTKYYVSHTSASGHFFMDLDPVFIVPSRADVRVVATSSSTGTGVVAAMHGYLASVVDTF